MDPSEEQFVPKKNWFAAHRVLGWVFLLTVATATIAGIYYWQTVSNLPYGYQVPVHKDATAKWKTFSDTNFKFTIQYPSNLTLNSGSDFPGVQYYIRGEGVPIGEIVIPQDLYPKTNFGEASLQIAESSKVSSATCNSYATGIGENNSFTDSEVINGEKFAKASFTDVGLGNLYATHLYHIYHQGTCFELNLIIHTSNIQNYDPSQGIKAVDENLIWGKLTEILATFKFTDSQTSGSDCTKQSNPPYTLTICKSISFMSGPVVLGGHATIGPFCPTSSFFNPYPCTMPNNIYSGVKVVVNSNGHFVTSADLDSNGNYSVNLTPGTYSVDINWPGYNFSRDPVMVTLVPNQIVGLDFNMDTGIK